MILVQYLNRETKARVSIEIDEKSDPFDVCNAVRDRLFPWEFVKEKDSKFEAVMKARKKNERR
jgi:hypothetical protein